MKKQKIVIIGAGFGGLASAALLAKKGHDVTVLEKNSMPGGRAWQLEKDGFKFDMGPSWYMMPEVFESLFEELEEDMAQYYTLEKLSPTYRAFFDDEQIDIYSDMEKNKEAFERLEKGSWNKVNQILNLGGSLYNDSIMKFLYKPFLSIFEFLDIKFIIKLITQRLFISYESYINSKIKSEKLRSILSWHTVFIGGTPAKVPAVFILMLYVDLILGTYYPKKGMFEVSDSLHKIAKKYGAKFSFDEPVEKIEVENGRAKSVKTPQKSYPADIVISNADYQHTEQVLLDPEYRSYPKKHWQGKLMSPSTYLLFLGIDKKLNNLEHHNYYFTSKSDDHFKSIEQEKTWPDEPSIYFNCASKSDPTNTPDNCENIMALVPVAPGVEDTEELRSKMYKYVIEKLEHISGENIKDHIITEEIFAHNSFIQYYNAYKGNAFGLANTMFQTGSFRPQLISKKVNNLYFASTTTIPGVGMPLAIISGQLVTRLIEQNG